jgi:O-antigen/teichoic acid export membrane protein
MVSRAVSAGLGFIGLMFIFRYLGADTYGTISWSLALVATFNCIADLGFNAAHLKRLSEGKDPSDCVSTYLIVKLLLTCTMVVIVLSSLFVWTELLGFKLTDSSMNIIFMFILYHVFYDVAHLATYTFDAKLESAKTQITLLMDPLIRVPLVIFISVNRLDDLTLSYAYVVGGLAMAIAGLFILSQKHLRIRKPVLFKSYMVFAVPIATISIMSALMGNIDKVTIGFFWSSTDVGYYTGASRILELLLMIGLAVSTLTFPAFSKMHSEGNLDEVRDKTRKAERYISMIAFPAVTLIWVFAPEVCMIILGGEEFKIAGDILRLLSVSTLIILLNEIYFSQINAVNRPDLSAKLWAISLSVNIAFLLLLVPPSLIGFELPGLAGEGAALARVFSFATLLVSTRFIVWKLTKTSMNPRLLLMIPAAVITGLALVGLSMIWPMERWWDLFGYMAVTLAIFGGLLALFGELKREDIDYFLNVVNPKEMKDYIVSEMKRK